MTLWGLGIKMIFQKYWIVFKWGSLVRDTFWRYERIDERIFYSEQEAADYICQQENLKDYGMRNCWRSHKWYYKQIAKKLGVDYDELMMLAALNAFRWQLNKFSKTGD